MAEIIKFTPKLVEKHVNAVNSLLKAGEIKQAQDYLRELPVNIRIKINASFKKRYAEGTE